MSRVARCKLQIEDTPSRNARCKLTLRWLCRGMILLLAVGCGRSGPEVAPVRGHVTLDGHPLVAADIEFQPDDKRPPSEGRTDQDGNYELLYKRGVVGAPVGQHIVRISFYRNAIANPPKIPDRYNKQSELRREVKAGQNEFDFDLKSEAK